MIDKCLDVSHHQGPIKWSLVAKAGYKLAFIKATQGTRFVDSLFYKNCDAAQDVGILVVPYHFINNEPANIQAGHFINVAKLRNQSPYMLDWEQLDNSLPNIKIVEEMGESLKIQTGRDPLIYRGLHEPTSKILSSWPWFVPRWNLQPPDVKWLFWQDTDKMSVPGIQGRVDRDKFNGTMEELAEWHATGRLPEVLKTPTEILHDLGAMIAAVKDLQRLLVPLYEGKIDGDPGSMTIAALEAWRARYITSEV